MSGWDACTMEPNSALRWIECHPGLAGYVQAIGVIAGVMIALFGPSVAQWIEQIRKRRERARMTVTLANALLGSVKSLVEMADARLTTIGTYDEPVGQDWMIFFDNMMIEIPGALDMSLVTDVDIDRSRLAFLQKLVDAARGYNMRLSTARREGVSKGEYDALKAEIVVALASLKKRAFEACSTIETM